MLARVAIVRRPTWARWRTTGADWASKSSSLVVGLDAALDVSAESEAAVGGRVRERTLATTGDELLQTIRGARLIDRSGSTTRSTPSPPSPAFAGSPSPSPTFSPSSSLHTSSPTSPPTVFFPQLGVRTATGTPAPAPFVASGDTSLPFRAVGVTVLPFVGVGEPLVAGLGGVCSSSRRGGGPIVGRGVVTVRRRVGTREGGLEGAGERRE